MTNEQYEIAKTDLTGRLQVMREAESRHHAVNVDSSTEEETGPTSDSGDGDNDDLDDDVERSASTEMEKALEEWRNYCNLVKKRKYVPKSFKGETVLLDDCIETGVVKERGEDIKKSPPFKKCNLADYVDGRGHFNLVGFLKFQQDAFPYLFKLAVCLASIRTNEVGCERFFSTAGYVSSPRRTCLKVHNYESMASLMRNMQKVFIDEEWIVHEYLRMEKKKSWDELESQEDLLVLNLEQEIYAENMGLDVTSLTPVEDITAIELDDTDTDTMASDSDE
jgi:hypothetical protein